jgi:enoyl-CoA hydratase/carnithine racemase
MDEILLENRDGIALVTLNRPERLNSLHNHMQPNLGQIIDRVRNDPAAKALVVTGAGRGFCAGYDAQALLEYPAETSDMGASGLRRPTADTPGPWMFTQLRIPTVAAINGPAVGVGAEMTATCDVRIAGEAARVGWVFPQRGLVPDAGVGPWLLPRIVGLSRAARIMFSGEILNATQLLELGFVERVVPDDQLIDAAIATARTLSSGAPAAIAETKRLLYQGLERDMATHSADNQETLRRMMLSEDFQEGVRSFMEKRPPVWTGR